MLLTRRNMICGGIMLGASALSGCSLLIDDGQRNQGTDNQVLSSPVLYSAGEPFDLVGGGSSSNFEGVSQPEDAFPWIGTMRFTVSSPVLYESKDDIADDIKANLAFTNEDTGQLILVEIGLENIDAVCKEYIARNTGSPSFYIRYFSLNSSQPDEVCGEAGYGSNKPLYRDFHETDRTSEYTWVEPGESVTIWALFSTYITSDDVTDAAEKGHNYTLVFEPVDGMDNPPRVALGPAVPWQDVTDS